MRLLQDHREEIESRIRELIDDLAAVDTKSATTGDSSMPALTAGDPRLRSRRAHRATPNHLTAPTTQSTSMTTIPDSHTDLLTRPLYAHLATIRPDGSPHNPDVVLLGRTAPAVHHFDHPPEVPECER